MGQRQRQGEEKVGLIYTDQGDSPEEVAAVDGGWGTQGIDAPPSHTRLT